MIIRSLAAALIAAVSLISIGSTASEGLPPGARVTASLPLPGVPNITVAAYVDGGPFVALVSDVPGRVKLLWSRALPYGVDRLEPGPVAGTFRGILRPSTGPAGCAFAWRRVGSSMRSALSGSESGIECADESAHINHRGFVLRRHIKSHTGSVAYRHVITYTWTNSAYAVSKRIVEPDYEAGLLPVPSAEVTNTKGDTYLLRLEVASTEAERETGLMNRPSLDPDSGMIFVWPQLVHESFWMENTDIPLTVAFLGPSGILQETQDMQAQTTVLHTPASDYRFAIEANLGYFASRGIRPGDQFTIRLTRTG